MIYLLTHLKKISIKINQLEFNLIPTGIRKNRSQRVVDLLIYKNHYAFTKKLHVLLGNHNKRFICGVSSNSFTSENMLLIHNPKIKITIFLLSQLQVILIFIGKIIFIKIIHFLGFMQILKLIMKVVILV